MQGAQEVMFLICAKSRDRERRKVSVASVSENQLGAQFLIAGRNQYRSFELGQNRF
jgi:hypothetical protein